VPQAAYLQQVTTQLPIRTLLLAAAAAGAVIASSACETSTSKLSADRERQFQSEGVTRRADDVLFRYTRDPGGRTERREDRRASIIVTGSSLLIHKNEKVGIEITPRTRRQVSVERSGTRIRIRTGRGRAEEIWSFEPPDNAEGWVRDIRKLLHGTGADR